MDNIIVIKNLFKEFKLKSEKIRAIENLNLTIKSNEIFCIVGPSGSGKSTLLHIIGGLLKPTSGSVTVNNIELFNMNAKQQNEYRAKSVGFVFQMFHLMPHLSVLENVMLPMQLIKNSKSDCLKRASELLESVGMSDRLNSKPSQLSGGEQQRVAIARALANDPDIIIADEPTGNLDELNEEKIIEIFKVLKSLNKTILIVTHNRNIVTHADRVLELSKIKGEVNEINFENVT